MILSTIAETSLPNEGLHGAGSGSGSGAGGRHRLQPEQDLRQRASSPLLGQSSQSHNRRNHASRSPAAAHQHYSKHAKNPLRASESASALHHVSHDPLQLPPTAPQEPMAADEPHSDISSDLLAPPTPTSHSATDDLKSTPPVAMGTFQERRGRRDSSSKSKLRPMMDLSKLFPKPRPRSPRLLSPNRMMASPSPVSMVSEESSNRTPRFYESRNKWGRNSRRNDSISRHQGQEQQEWQGQYQQQQQQEQDQQSQYEREYADHGYYERRKVPKPFRTEHTNIRTRKPGYLNWFDGPQGQVSDDEDSGIDIDSETQFRERWPADDHYASSSVYSSTNSLYSSAPSNRTSARSGASSRTVQPSPNPSGRASSARTPTTRTPSTVTERDRSLRSNPPDSIKPAASRQNHNAAFGASNLNESSVLCLSSDDEEEGEENGMSKSENRTFMRDSIATFDDGEICTAKAAVAASRRPSIRSVRPNATPQPKSSAQSSPQSLEFHLPRRSSQRSQTSQTADRRSRFLAVTKQEEHFLENLRRNKGAVPPSFFSDNDSIASTDTSAARQSLTGYNPESSSFLRLSVGGPPTKRSPRSNTGTNEEQTGSRRGGGGGGGSDYGDQNTDRSTASPRISLVHSDAMPSPSTGLTSPRTPTSMSAAQRFSLQSPHPPPSYSPPPVPDQNRHSRTRTDSSSALVFNGGNDNNNNNGETGKEIESAHDLPIWALGWNQEISNEIAVAH